MICFAAGFSLFLPTSIVLPDGLLCITFLFHENICETQDYLESKVKPGVILNLGNTAMVSKASIRTGCLGDHTATRQNNIYIGCQMQLQSRQDR